MKARPARRERVHARTKEDIIASAARVFARDGFSGSTMEAIAREADYTAPALYTYFKSKDEIFAGLVEALTEEFLGVFEEPTLSGITFVQRLELLLGSLFGLAERRREAFVVFFSLTTNQDLLPRKRGDKPRVPGYLLLLERTEAWFEHFAPKPMLALHPASELAQFLFGVCNAFFMGWLRPENEATPLSKRSKLVLKLFLSGAGIPSATVVPVGDR